MDASESAPIALSAAEQAVLSVLQSGGELHVTQIAEGAAMPVYETSATLAALEIKNLIVRAGANRYAALK